MNILKYTKYKYIKDENKICYNMMTPAEQVFGIFDLKQKILEHRTDVSIPELTKKIYPKWNYNPSSKEHYIKGKSGPNCEPQSVVTRWSLSRTNYGDIDDSPIIVTDMVIHYENNEKLVEKMDGLVNDSHLKIKDQYWYIPKLLLKKFIIEGRDDELDDYFEIVESFINVETEKRFKRLDNEMIRRNESAEYLVYKNIPSINY